MPLALWSAALIVAGGLLMIAAIAALLGGTRSNSAVPPVPGEAVDSMRYDLETLKERAKR